MTDFFPSTKFFQKGYDQDAVNSFFEKAREAYEQNRQLSDFTSEHVRNAAFPMRRGGYDPAAVDAALDRMEGAFVTRDRADHVAVNGEQAWLNHAADRATTLYPRLVRPVGERFAHPAKGKQGYDSLQVDDFLDRLGRFFDDEDTLTAEEVRHLTFKVAKGAEAYKEGPVDAYLSRVIEILLAVE